MTFLDKLSQTASKAGRSMVTSAAKLSLAAATAAQGQSEIIHLKNQLNTINQELNLFYTQIGKIYTDYILESGGIPATGTEDLLEQMRPKIAQKHELEDTLSQIESMHRRKPLLPEPEEEQESLEAQEVQENADVRKKQEAQVNQEIQEAQEVSEAQEAQQAQAAQKTQQAQAAQKTQPVQAAQDSKN